MKYMKYLAMLFLIGLLFQVSILYGAVLRPKAKEFPDKTIIIGTHAIYIDIMTEDLLNTAMATAQSSGQIQIYFKSDINRGVWYDITTSTNIMQISVTTDNIVDEAVIDKLDLDYYTNPEGTTINLKTGQKTEISALNDLTEPKNMDDLSGLAEEYDINKALYKSDKKKVYKENYESIDTVLKKIPINYTTDFDKKITAIDNYVNRLKEKGEKIDKINLISKQREEITKQKDAFCYQVVLNRINHELDELDYMDSSSLIAKYADYATKLQASLDNLGVTTERIEENAQMIEDFDEDNSNKDSSNKDDSNRDNSNEDDSTENMSATDLVEKQTADTLMKAILSGDNTTADSCLDKLSAVNQIKNHVTATDETEKQNQMNVLKDIKNIAASKISNLASNGGANEAYQQAVKAGENKGTLEKYEKESIHVMKAALDDLNQTDELINTLLVDDADKMKQLEQSKNICDTAMNSMIINAIGDEMQTILAENSEKLSQSIRQLQLNAIPEYQQANDKKESSNKIAEELNEKYLSAVEEGNQQIKETLKSQLDKAVTKKLEAEREVERLEEQFDNGQLKSPLSNKEDSVISNNQQGSKNSNSQQNDGNSNHGQGNESFDNQQNDRNSNHGQGNESSDNQQSDGNSNYEQGNESSDNQQNDGNSDYKQGNESSDNQQNDGNSNHGQGNESSDNQQDGKDSNGRIEGELYTQEEKTALINEVQELNQQFKQYEFVTPWTLIFEDYTVKLMSPVIKDKKEFYIPAIELARQLNSQVIYSKTNDAIVIKGKGALIEFTKDKDEIYINDKKAGANFTPITMKGKIYLPLSCFEKAFSFFDRTEGEYTIVYK